MDENIRIPDVDQPLEERLLFIQENMVSFIQQYSMPVVEVALVISKYIRILVSRLQEVADATGESLPLT